MHYRVKVTKTKYTYTTSMKTSSTRTKKNPSLTNVSSEVRRSPRLKQNMPSQKQENKIPPNLRSSKNLGRKKGSNAVVLKKFVLNVGEKEKEAGKKLVVATQPLTYKSSMKTRSSKKARHKTGFKAVVGKNIGLDADGKENFKDSSDDESAICTQPLTRESSMKTRSSKTARQRTGSKAFVGKNIGLNANRKENFKDCSDDESLVATQPVTNKSSRKLRSPEKIGSKAFFVKNIGLERKENFKDSSDTESVVATQPLTCESATRKINPNVTYSKSLLPKRFQSAKIKDSMKENPSQKIGRRSGEAAFAGKIIGLLPDGTENFADYWTDTESSSTDNSTCGSAGKKNNTTYNKYFSIVPESQQAQRMNESFSSVPESQLSLKMNNSFSSVPESQQSPRKNMSFSFSSVPKTQQSPKKKTTPIKDMGKSTLLKTGSAPPKIGRRTGSAAFVGKTIRLLPDGTENFEDYWTDEASSEASGEPEALDYSKEALNNTYNDGVGDSSSVRIQNQKETSVLHSANNEPSLSKSPKESDVQAIRENSLNENILESFEEEKVVGDRSENVSLQDSPNVTSQGSFKDKYECVANDRSENVLPQDSPSVSSENSFKCKQRSPSRSSRKRSLEHINVEGDSANENKIASIRSTKSLCMDSKVSRSSRRNSEESGNELENIARDSGKEFNDVAKDLSKEFENIAKDSGKEVENIAEDSDDVVKDLSKEFEDICRDSAKEFETVARDPGKEFENPRGLIKDFETVAKGSGNELEKDVSEDIAMDLGNKFEDVAGDLGNEYEEIPRDSGNEIDDFRVNKISTRDGCIIEKAAAIEKLNSPNAKRKSKVLENDTEDLPQGNGTVPEEKAPIGPKSKKRKRDKIPQEPVRRSARESVPPLAFWHGERRKHRIICGEFFYQGIDSGWKKDEGAFSALARIIYERKKTYEKLKKTKKQALKKTRVMNPHTNEFVNVELHKPFGSADWSSIKGDDRSKVPYYLTKTFMSEKMSFGFLDLCPLQVKGSQYSPDDNIHFVVQKGRVKVDIHNTTFEFEKNDSFIVPNMEMYSIENLRNSHALLSFTTFKVPFFPYQCNE